MQNTFYWDGGVKALSTGQHQRAAGYSGTGPYFVPNIHVDSYACTPTILVGGAMRGFGMPEIHFGIEQHIDAMRTGWG